MKILPPRKIYIDKSPVHGWGVFALENIKNGELIEKTVFVDMQMKDSDPDHILIDYRFNWPQGNTPEKIVLPGGYGMFYNHSNQHNAYWRTNQKDSTFEYYALRDIEKGEEIFTFYGSDVYWDMIKKVKEQNQ